MFTGEERRETAAGLGFCWLHPNLPCREISYITADSKMGFQAEHQLAFLKAFLSEFFNLSATVFSVPIFCCTEVSAA